MWNGRVYNGFTLGEDYGHAARVARRCLGFLDDVVVGMVKINFSGGEPFLPDRGRFVGELVKYCKQELKLPSVSIVSNGSLIRETWFADYGAYIVRLHIREKSDYSLYRLVVVIIIIVVIVSQNFVGKMLHKVTFRSRFIIITAEMASSRKTR